MEEVGVGKSDFPCYNKRAEKLKDKKKKKKNQKEDKGEEFIKMYGRRKS